MQTADSNFCADFQLPRGSVTQTPRCSRVSCTEIHIQGDKDLWTWCDGVSDTSVYQNRIAESLMSRLSLQNAVRSFLTLTDLQLLL